MKFINENNMLHSILTFISKYQDIYLLTSNQKQTIKTKIQKLKESIFKFFYINANKQIKILNIKNLYIMKT